MAISLGILLGSLIALGMGAIIEMTPKAKEAANAIDVDTNQMMILQLLN